MTQSVEIDVKIDAKLKEEAEAILGEMGIHPDEAITMLYKEIALKKEIPEWLIDASALEGIQRGLEAVEAGKTIEMTPQYFEELKARIKKSALND